MQDVKRKQSVTSPRGALRHVELSEREQAWADEFALEGVCLVSSQRNSTATPAYMTPTSHER